MSTRTGEYLSILRTELWFEEQSGHGQFPNGQGRTADLTVPSSSRLSRVIGKRGAREHSGIAADWKVRAPGKNRKAGLLTRPVRHILQRELNLFQQPRQGPPSTRYKDTSWLVSNQSPVLGTGAKDVKSLNAPTVEPLNWT